MVLRSSRQPRRLSWIEDSRGLPCKAYASLPYSLANLPSWSLVFRVLSKNARFQMQSLNLDLKTKTFFKANFLLDCRWIGEFLWVSYFHLFLINQQPALWPSGVDDEKEFPEVADTKTREDFLFPWNDFSSMAAACIGLIRPWDAKSFTKVTDSLPDLIAF